MAQREVRPRRFVDEAGLELHRNVMIVKMTIKIVVEILITQRSFDFRHAREENVWQVPYKYSRCGATRGQAMTVC